MQYDVLYFLRSDRRSSYRRFCAGTPSVYKRGWRKATSNLSDTLKEVLRLKNQINWQQALLGGLHHLCFALLCFYFGLKGTRMILWSFNNCRLILSIVCQTRAYQVMCIEILL
ncbi:hypothetical protein KP509_36G066500 [Ceratopteris richardii]|uniref:Uncharacterized protein n=1 Tax=Ceratopteris richardii TaxID=49495 RepID=A0A8T2QFA5_CERRI|nr:hypothetical protein KP509_36G066500 [Ceratopteris richardii]